VTSKDKVCSLDQCPYSCYSKKIKSSTSY